MRAQDKSAFCSAAEVFDAWILVRETNPFSLDYIDKVGYIPKPIHCKANTAKRDSDGFKLAGLVASPIIHASAFDITTKLMENWSDLEARFVEDGSGFSLDQSKESKHFGCVKFGENYMYGDYDLYDVIFNRDSRGKDVDPRRNFALVGELHGVEHNCHPRFPLLQRHINSLLKKDLIQHGAWAQFGGHLEGNVLRFSPKGEILTLSKQEVLSWYSELNRKTRKENW
jgi:hypothetical protein